MGVANEMNADWESMSKRQQIRHEKREREGERECTIGE